MMSSVLSDADISARLQKYPVWQIDDDGWLRTDTECEDFKHALLLVNAIGFWAETLNHHPDITIHRYRYVSLRLKSHDVNGITERDFRLIARLESMLSG